MTRGELPKSKDTIEERPIELESLPHRNTFLHWSAFGLSLMSLILLSIWVFGDRETVPIAWIWIDIGLGIIFAVEFFTRSVFRWEWSTYLRTRFFDFVAIVPAITAKVKKPTTLMYGEVRTSIQYFSTSKNNSR